MLAQPSLNIGEDGKQTFEASMMTADNLQASNQLWPYRDVHRLLSMLMQRNAVPDSTVSIKTDITQPVGELRCAKCMHAGRSRWHNAPSRAASHIACLGLARD
jgi:hypothetical protein